MREFPHGAPGERIPVIVIAGPTGTGKSALALNLASRHSGVIINTDSRQVYADFPIITAQPDSAMREAIPHRLYGFLPCREKLGAGAYAELAAKEIAAATAAGKTPILVGGTGLYLKTLLSGIAPIPAIAPEISRRWQEECAERGAPALHALLAERDPQTAARLHPHDSQRVTRALEVLDGTGNPLSYWHSLPVPASPYAALRFLVDLPLGRIEPRLAGRIKAMIEAGAVDEARRALALCDDPAAPGWSGIGCAELYAHLAGKMDFAACKAAWVHNTRAYAKRQITWFKRENGMARIAPEDRQTVFDRCAAFIGTWQNNSRA